MSKLWFKILKKKWKARIGQIELNGITLTTPVFMPVGTNATIKWIPLEWMSASYLGSKDPIQLILANTFHLYLRPGMDVIQKAWWLHRFENRNKLLLTDSWWFQVFSLWLSKTGKPLIQLHKDRVDFVAPHNGSKHTFTPTGTVDLQRILGSDIMMMLDVCSPTHASKKEVAEHMDMTHTRAAQQYRHHMEQYDKHKWVLFPIIQWGLHQDLREESARILSSYATDGIAIWWLSVGEAKTDMHRVLDDLWPDLPEDKPRYLMWVGTPEDLYECIYRGIDMFDCVLPTRLGRHGCAFTPQGIIKLKKSCYREDFSPIDETSLCYSSRHFSKAYLHHLMKCNEMLGASLLSLHNIAYLHGVVEKIKQDILNS